MGMKVTFLPHEGGKEGLVEKVFRKHKRRYGSRQTVAAL